jgi:hypothetical protein
MVHMINMTAKFIEVGFSGLARRPLLTAMTVYFIGFGVAALIVTFAAPREATCNQQKSHKPYMALITPNIAGQTDPRDLTANILNLYVVWDQPGELSALIS